MAMLLTVSDDLHKKLKLLSVMKGKTIKELTEEAVRDLLKKYGEEV